MSMLVYLMGASGAGKDSLLDALRQAAVPRLLVAHRYITRPAGMTGENHIALSQAEFALRRDNGLFALYWQAHDCQYAIGAEIDLWLTRRLDVVVNGSRAYLPHAQARYGQRLLPICLTVAPDVLRQRLMARGRESPAQIDERLQRAETAQRQLPATCLFIENNGPLADTANRFRALLAHPISA
ncbi:ribose 1,5-bisphosphokinase [Zymobacter palmae]|uniref:Ribose 1,5-bisphosphate phosphokinase PhnN n=1 Tax=Zymobacter palmae TaxID=33074 RepID=A0A348HFI4_9GAMM|nr:ribose 1,5-bisphosphokinase [Zymobacter palmae]BBG30386.1 ribose 1,5-bisphosphokinase [Zymobacter palmae]